MSNVSALTCGQVSEVSSQGEASAPTFAPKIVQGVARAAGGRVQLSVPAGAKPEAVKVVGQPRQAEVHPKPVFRCNFNLKLEHAAARAARRRVLANSGRHLQWWFRQIAAEIWRRAGRVG